VEQRRRFRFWNGAENFDLIFLDPPYDSGLLDAALQKIQNIDILNDGGIIICESSRENAVKSLSEPDCLLNERNYGKIRITVCGKRANT
jgi:16S rRNA G966 N2-methylase RsmD